MLTKISKNIAGRLPSAFWFLLTIAIQGFLLFYFYNRYAWFPDEGFSIHIAERLAHGQVLNRDVQSIHPGYFYFLNAWALQWFGMDMVSLRYPLITIAFLQGVIIFSIFARTSPPAAFLCSMAGTILGVLQYLNPNQNWYCLALAWAAVWLLLRKTPEDSARIFCLGMLLGIVYLFRQLTAVWLGMGILTYLLLEQSDQRIERWSLGRLLVAGMWGVLGLYLVKTSDGAGWILYGIGPLVFLLWVWRVIQISNRKTVMIVGNLVVGGLVAFIPMAIYLFQHQTLGAWWQDTFVMATSVTAKDYMYLVRHREFITDGWQLVLRHANAAEVLNGLFWIILPFIAAVNAILLLTGICFSKNIAWKNWVIPIVAVFYAIVCVHNQNFYYLFHVVGLSLLGIVWMCWVRYPRGVWAAVLLTIWLSAVGLYYHAAQPLAYRDFMRGERIPLAWAGGKLERVNLWVDPIELDVYDQLTTLIKSKTVENEAIFVLPYSNEIYFLADRPNPFRSAFLDASLRDQATFEVFMEEFLRKSPQLVVNKYNDKRQTRWTAAIMDQVKVQYRHLERIGVFDVYEYVGP